MNCKMCDCPTYSSNLYWNVKYLCYEKNINLGKLERDLGLSTGYLGRLAKGGRSIGLDSAIAVAEYLGVNLKDLCKTPEPNKAKIDILNNKIKEMQEEIERLKGE